MKRYQAPDIEVVRFQAEDVLDNSYVLEDDEPTPIFHNPFQG